MKHNNNIIKSIILTIFTLGIIVLAGVKLNAQVTPVTGTCEEILEYVEENYSGTSYRSYFNDNIELVRFYDTGDEYFAVVSFTSTYQKYIYLVDSTTEFDYSWDYTTNADQAFSDYIHPHRDNLGCIR